MRLDALDTRALAAREWDLLVVGGGISGAGILLDAARRQRARVAAVDDLKDAVGVGAIERQIAGLIEDEQVWALQLREL